MGDALRIGTIDYTPAFARLCNCANSFRNRFRSKYLWVLASEQSLNCWLQYEMLKTYLLTTGSWPIVHPEQVFT
jgi:hypothetical protein